MTSHELSGPKPERTWQEVMADARKRHRPRLRDWARDGFATTRRRDFEALGELSEPSRAPIARVAAESLTPDEFAARFEATSTPVVIEGVPRGEGWPAARAWAGTAALRARRPELLRARFKVGEDDDGRPVRVRLRHYLDYVDADAEGDDSPLCARARSSESFERTAVGGDEAEARIRAPSLVKGTSSIRRSTSAAAPAPRACSTTTPCPRTSPTTSLRSSASTAARRTDGGCPAWLLFERDDALVADDADAAPHPPPPLPLSRAPSPLRWLVGAKRSGTCAHVDPLGTSAWNTVLSGRKRWALLPPHTCKKVAKGKTVLRAGEDDEAVHYFVDLLPRMKRAHERLPLVEV